MSIRLALATAAAAFALTGAASAQSIVGHLELGVGAWGGEGWSATGLFSTTARVNKELHDSWNLEVEALGEAQFSGGYGYATNVGAYAHLWKRTPMAAYGVFGGVSFLGLTTGAVGAEAKHYLTNATLGVQAAYNFTSYSGYGYGQIAAFGNYYFNPNHRIGFRAQYFFGDAASGSWELTADVEHGFGNALSLWASASYFDNYGYGFWRGLVGFRLFLDQPGATIQSNERNVPWQFHPELQGPLKRIIIVEPEV